MTVTATDLALEPHTAAHAAEMFEVLCDRDAGIDTDEAFMQKPCSQRPMAAAPPAPAAGAR
jgi:hypothetical protein